MKEKIKIYLPSNTCPQDMFVTILKLIGIKPSKYRLGKNHMSVDVGQPCSKKNQWELVFTKPKATRREEISDQHNIIHIEDYSLVPFPCSFDFYKYGQIGEEILNKEQLLIGDFNAFTGIIGKRLVDFFGGRIVFSDNNSYICQKPKFNYSKAKITNLINFQNILSTEAKITPEEIVELRKNGINNPLDLLILHSLNKDFLKSYLEMEQLDKELNDSNEQKLNKKMKI
jgi:hypothetical protein